jgi:hypothetical protein
MSETFNKAFASDNRDRWIATVTTVLVIFGGGISLLAFGAITFALGR